jgi:hypothetical protein
MLCNRAANLRRRKKKRQRDMCVKEGVKKERQNFGVKKERQNFDLSRNIDTVGRWWMGKGRVRNGAAKTHVQIYVV